jgi:DNA-binding MarR family transcriptional regulator
VSDAPGTSLLFDVFALNQAVGRLMAAAMRDGPLTPAEYAVYSAVFELEAASPTQLAARLGMRLTTFMDQLRPMERRGHARRVGHPTDGRSYRVVLTAAGLEAHRAANRLFERADEALRASMGASGPAAREGLDTIRRAVDSGLAALGPDPTPRRPVGRAG